jgi:hypothetical protein
MCGQIPASDILTIFMNSQRDGSAFRSLQCIGGYMSEYLELLMIYMYFNFIQKTTGIAIIPLH